MRHKVILRIREPGFLAIGVHIEDATAPAFGLSSLEECAGNLLVDRKGMGVISDTLQSPCSKMSAKNLLRQGVDSVRVDGFEDDLFRLQIQ